MFEYERHLCLYTVVMSFFFTFILVFQASITNFIGSIHIFAIVYVLTEYIVDNTPCTFVEHFVQCWSKNQNVDSQNG